MATLGRRACPRECSELGELIWWPARIARAMVGSTSRHGRLSSSPCRVRTLAFSGASARIMSECSSEGERFLGTLTLDLLQNGALRIRLGRDLDAEYVR